MRDVERGVERREEVEGCREEYGGIVGVERSMKIEGCREESVFRCYGEECIV